MKKILKSSLSLVLALTLILSSAAVGLSEIDLGGAGAFIKTLLPVFSVKSNAASESDLTFTLNEDGQSYSVTDCGDYATGELVIPSTYNGLPVTGIGDSAFFGCYNLTSITIPDSVTSIGDDAFWDCSSLTSVTIPDSITSIGGYAFANCHSLTSVYITDITAWCNISFGSTSSNLLGYHGDNLYLNGELVTDLAIPDSVTKIPAYAFSCTSLTSITIPDSVTSIGDSAFEDCSSLTSITIPNSVTSIGDSAFSSCDSLTSITIPDSVTSIGDSTFEDCSSLTSITIPNSVTSIGDSAFSSCDSLISINVGANNQNYSSVEGVLFNKDKTELIHYPAKKTNISYTIPDSVTRIGSDAFSGCDSLTSITIPDSVTSIGSDVFSGCDSLTSITIPDSVTRIGRWAFGNCSSLTSVAIGNSVTSISDYAFYDCTSLTSITIPDSVTSIGYMAFSWCINLTSITIPDSVTSIGIDAFYGTAYYNNSANWENNVLYIGNHLIEANYSISGEYEIKTGTKVIANSAFRGRNSLTSITIPDSVTTIGDEAFYYCTNLTSVYITDIAAWCNISFEDNYSNPLYYADNLYLNGELVTDLVIPESVTSIESRALSGCDSIASINVNENNPNYSSVDGILFNKDKTELIQYPAGKTNTSYIIPDSVKKIGERAFEDCTNLTSITIPDSVTSIDYYAFSGCRARLFGNKGSYAETYANNNSRPFVPLDGEESEKFVSGSYGKVSWSVDKVKGLLTVTCDGAMPVYTESEELPWKDYNGFIEEIVISNATTISDYAFKNMYYVRRVTISDSVTSIGDCAFYDCDSLISITIPDSVTSIGSSAFYCCYSLTTITIPDSVTSIGDCAFYDCDNLTSITIPDSVTSIGSDAFYDCDNLISITIPDSVTCIGDWAFYGCKSLTSVTIGNNVTSIGYDAFSRCYSLVSINVGVNNPNYSSVDGVLFNKDKTELIQYTAGNTRTEYVIPDSVTSIGNKAFWHCDSLTSITIPVNVSFIGSNTFCHCTGLEKVNWNAKNVVPSWYDADHFSFSGQKGSGINFVFGDSVEKIPAGIFRVGASGHEPYIKTITIGNNVTNMEEVNLSDCTFLTNFIVDETNKNYCLVDGVLYNKNQTEITKYPKGRTDTSYVIPNNVISIGSGAFSGCHNLTSVTIPDSVTSIGVDAFYWCGIKDVYYTGSESGWENINISDGNEDLLEANIHFATLKQDENGVWKYMSGNKVIEDYTGLVLFNGGWFYVANGILDWNFTGLVEYCGNYYHVNNGVLDWNYTGLSYYNGNWWYVTNGVIDWSYTGLTYFYDTWYYVTNGFLDWNVTTLTYFYDVWYYVENGVLNWNYTGLVEFYGQYYHIENGVLDWGYTGLSYYQGNWWYVTNGVIDWSYTGLTYYYGTWYYVVNGYLDWNVTTLTYFCDVWYYVENGQINWNSNTLCYYGDTWYYVKGGTVAWDYTGWVEYYGGWYYITNGWLDWSKQ